MATGDGSYDSAVVAPLQLGLGVLSGIAAAAVLWALGLWPAAIAAFVVIVAVAWWIGVVGLRVTAREVTLRQTRGRRGGREVLVRNIESAQAARFGWAETFGLGSRVPAGTATLVVQPGPGLRLLLATGEWLHISTPDPQAALAAMGVRTETPRPRPRPGSGRRD